MSGPAGARPLSWTRRVEAAPEAVMDLLADPRAHARIDGSGTVRGTVHGPERLSLGSRFGMSMRYWGLPYRMPNVVTEFEDGRRIAWTTVAGVVWRYELEPDGPDACRVTETWDPSRSPFRLAYAALGFPGRTAAALRATLDRLAAATEPLP